MYAVALCLKRKIFSGDMHVIVEIHLMPGASHNHEPEPSPGIHFSWKDHGFSLSLGLGVIIFSYTISNCFFFNVFHRAVCFATCFAVPLKPRGSGCVCHFRTWISLGGFCLSVQWGNLQQVISFCCCFLERTQ